MNPLSLPPRRLPALGAALLIAALASACGGSSVTVNGVGGAPDGGAGNGTGGGSGTLVITTQPAAQTVTVGQSALFSVVASGASSYQWSKNGAAIAGATSADYRTPAIVAADAGAKYAVSVGGGGGSVASAAALLSINANADGAPPAAFWGKLASAPVATQSMTFSFVNATNGKYPDSQVFWGFSGTTSSGVAVKELHSIAEAPTYDMPAVSSARMYFYLAPNAAAAVTSDSSYFDFIEFNIGRSDASQPWSFAGNTTRVDAFGLKTAINLQCGDGTSVVRGEDYGTFLEDRTITFKKYLAEVPAEFAVTATKLGPYRILEPGAAGFNAGGAYASYFNTYIDQVWAANGIDTTLVPKPTPLLNFVSNQHVDLTAALSRHVAGAAGTFKADGTLVDPNFWRTTPASAYYQAAPGNYYAKFWHTHGIAGLAYGFPYDDAGSQSSYVSCRTPQRLGVAIGW